LSKLKYLSSEVGGTTLGHLQDDGGLLIPCSLEGGNNSGGGSDILLVDKFVERRREEEQLTMAGMAKFFSWA